MSLRHPSLKWLSNKYASVGVVKDNIEPIESKEEDIEVLERLVADLLDKVVHMFCKWLCVLKGFGVQSL
ncbi:hypothetical protein SUGI_0611010 [Cryptomeria japonica]|nr:hypothetical protein SUGI_0611010 [Cryptomeria japonica]